MLLYEAPVSPELGVPGKTGRLIPGAKVEVFRARGGAPSGVAGTAGEGHGPLTVPSGNTGTWTFASPPDATGYTDASGLLRLPNFNLWNRDGKSWEEWGWAALVRITYGGQQVYRVIDLTHANNAFRRDPAHPDIIPLNIGISGETMTFPGDGAETPVPTATWTATPTNTASPTPTASPTATPSITPSPAPTATATVTTRARVSTWLPLLVR